MYFPENTPKDVVEKEMRNKGLGEEDIKFIFEWLEKARGRDQEAKMKMEKEQELNIK